VSMATVTCQVREWLGHKGGAESVLFGDRLHHVLKKGMAIGGDEGIGIGPVHFKLTVGIFMIVLVGSPAQRQHPVTDFCNYVKAAHEGLLVVAGLTGCIAGVRELSSVGTQQKKLTLYACFDT
jgi:hypothetical protein